MVPTLRRPVTPRRRPPGRRGSRPGHRPGAVLHESTADPTTKVPRRCWPGHCPSRCCSRPPSWLAATTASRDPTARTPPTPASGPTSRRPPTTPRW